MGWKSIGIVALGLALAGCPDPETEYRLTGATYSFNITGCLGLPDNAGPSSCVQGMRRVASEIRGCVVLQSGGGERDAAEIVFEANGQISGGGALQVTLDSTLEGALYVFDVAGGDALGRCLGGAFAPGDACTAADGCVLKLYQTPVPGPAAGGGPDGGFSEINFRTPDGLCDVRWAGETPTDLCAPGDDDCDGDADEAMDAQGNPVAVGARCGDGVGGEACQVVWTCGDDGRAYCPDSGAGGQEACDGVDNDCDGTVDEGLVDCCPMPGTTRPCNTESDCPDGQQTCGQDRRWGPCLDPMTMMPIASEEPELCNGQDDDCDGFADEDFALGGPGGPTTGAACEVPNPPNACQSRGRVVCTDAMTAMCEPDAVQPQPEICDGADNDCDGTVDEDVPPQPCWGDVPEVNQGVGICVQGTQRCVEGGAGTFGECIGAQTPGDEVCQLGNAEQVDDDCDGEVDEGGFEPSCGLCPSEIRPEVCGNDIDENCNGRIDEAEPQDDPANCGACGNDCNVQGDVVYNAEFVCVAGECDAIGCLQGYFDLEPAVADGVCECRAQEERVGFDDLDCDGVEGATRNNSFLFVSPAHGADRGTGAAHTGRDRQNIPVAPFRSLQQALDEITVIRDGVQGVPAPITIVLDVGVYELREGLDVPEGVSILGGYRYEPGEDVNLQGLPPDEQNARLAREHGWRRVPVAEAAGDGEKTIIRGHHALLRYSNLRVDTVLDNVELQAANGVDDETRSSAVIIAEDVGDHLVIGNSVLVAGNGFDGDDGDDGASGTPSAANGADGTDHDEDPSAGLGGPGAPAPACAARVAPVDDGIPVASGGAGGDSGQDGQPGGRSSVDQPRSLGGDTGRNSPGSAGDDGASGPHGPNSVPGTGDGQRFDSQIPWAPRGSAPAQPGLPGAGGGGGGAGQPGNDPGGGGGGGGNGGCPGLGASGASGGGGSFGLIVKGGSVALYETTIRTGNGGAGGEGARGGLGATGGRGGRAGTGGGCGGCTTGGDGGDGGLGGCGGNSGGAAGGPSVAVLLIGASEIDFVRSIAAEQSVPNRAEVQERLLDPGDGGDGGRGGDAGGECGPAAANGPGGVSLPVGCCDDAATCSPGGPALDCAN